MSAQLRPGYKQTEVGVIPEDWSAVSLGSLTTLMTNGFVGTATKHYAENENGVLYIQGYNVEENSFNLHGIKYVTEDFHKAHAKSCLRAGDLLTVQTGDVGLTTVVPDDLAGSNCHALIISRFDKKRTSPGFVSYYLNSSRGRSRLRLIETGTTMKHLNVGDMLEFLVPAPPTSAEQDAITKALSDTVALIESLEQLVAKKRHLKQATMQELLTGKKRLPGFSDNWSVSRIGDVAQVKTGPFGSTLHESDYVQTGTPIITVEHLGEFGVVHQNLPLVSDEDCKRLQAYSLEVGDIVFSRVGSVDRNALISESEDGWLFSGRLLRVRAERNIVFPPFLSYQFHTETFRNSVLAVAVGQTMASLNTKILSNLTVLLPSIAEQSAIADTLSDMDAELADLDTQLDKTRALKQGMMHKLLTGEIRLL